MPTPANFPAFNPGTTVWFNYKGVTRIVTYITFRAAADGTWLLIGTDAIRDNNYRSFRVDEIEDLHILGRVV
jgi:hypothetical protein